jgi:hypothetical protein
VRSIPSLPDDALLRGSLNRRVHFGLHYACRLVKMVQDPYANYVLQTALAVSSAAGSVSVNLVLQPCQLDN